MARAPPRTAVPRKRPNSAEASALDRSGAFEAALVDAPAPEHAWTNEPTAPLSEPSAPPTQPNVEEALTAPVRAEADFPAPGPTSAEVEEGAPAGQAPSPAEAAPAIAPAGEVAAESGEAGEHEPAEPVDETPRPRRTGWWQRARASIVGN